MSTPIPVILAFAAAACFGLGLVLTQFGLRHMPAAAGACISIPTTALVVWMASPWALHSSGWRLDAIGLFALVGVFFPAVVTLLTFASNQRMGPTVTGTAGGTAPLFAIAGAVLFLGERLTLAATFGAMAIVAGVGLLTWQPANMVRRWPPRALLLPLAAACLRGAAQATTKIGLLLWPNPFAATLIGYTISSAVVATGLRWHPGSSARKFSRRGILWFAVVGLANGAAVFMLYAALNHGSVVQVAPIVATFPVFTLILDLLLLREERLTAARLAGVGLTVAGVVVLLT